MPAAPKCIEPRCERKSLPKCRRCRVHQPYFVGWSLARRKRNCSKPFLFFVKDEPPPIEDETDGREEIHAARGRTLTALFRGQ